MAEEAGLDECLVKNVQDNLDVLPSDMNLAGAEIEFQEIENKETLLKRYLDQVRDDYDFILMPDVHSISEPVFDAFDWTSQSFLAILSIPVISLKKSTTK